MKQYIKTIKKRITRIRKDLDKKTNRVKKRVSKRFSFVGVTKKKTAAFFVRIGRSIARVSPPWLRRVGRFLRRPFIYIYKKINLYLNRRPHRSFRLTRRRDYKRRLQIQGYWSFTNYVRRTLWKNKKLFGGLAIAYFLISLAISGFGQQDAYSNLSTTLTDAGGELFTGNWGEIGKAGILLTTAVATGLTPSVTEAQSVLGGLVVFLTWLATVWALRNILAGHRVKVREAIYSSGSPVVSTVFVAFVLVFQLLPIALAILIHSAAIDSGLISGGVQEMTLWCVLILLGVLSLYWVTSTAVALVVVTLPGMYPFQAIRTAGDLVVGRRLRILLRLLWGMGVTIIVWVLLVIPIILFDSWIKTVWLVIEWLPIVPIAILIMSSLSIVWCAAYVYLLYRKVVDDDASPA